MDFALWKASKPGEPSWESPWGNGRPGWHIECSAMSLHHLGEQIDIHGGGNDLIFPHHENEIAQTESFTGKPFARYWVHNGMMQLAGEKMSKSLGNLITIDEFLAEHEPDVLRMLILNSSYRSPLTFSVESVGHAKKALDRLRTGLRPASPDAINTPSDVLEKQIETTRQAFIEAMDDDFNTAGALGHLFDFVRVINHARDEGVNEAGMKLAQDLLLELTGIFGLQLDQKTSFEGGEVTPFIDLLLEIRSELRAQKIWDISDQIRDRLTDLDIILEDSKHGTTWRWK
jgi:cysteinyl-tRNA synthetase